MTRDEIESAILYAIGDLRGALGDGDRLDPNGRLAHAVAELGCRFEQLERLDANGCTCDNPRTDADLCQVCQREP